MTIKEEIQIEEYKRTFAEAYKQGFMDAMSACKTKSQTYVINPQEPTNDDKCFECDDFFTCGGQCNKVKSADRLQGEWKSKNHHTDYCSNCGFEETQWRTVDYNFCPSCGARMKGADDEH